MCTSAPVSSALRSLRTSLIRHVLNEPFLVNSCSSHCQILFHIAYLSVLPLCVWAQPREAVMSTQETSHSFTGLKDRVRSSLRLSVKSSQRNDLSQTLPNSEGSPPARGSALEAQERLAVPSGAAGGPNDRRSQRNQRSSNDAVVSTRYDQT